MILMLHAIAEKVGADLSQDLQLHAFSEVTQPERLIEQIEAQETVKAGGLAMNQVSGRTR